jgi:hypothetical protein
MAGHPRLRVDEDGGLCCDDHKPPWFKYHSIWKEDVWADDPEARANGERLAACWNALSGIENPEEWVRKAKEAMQGVVDLLVTDDPLEDFLPEVEAICAVLKASSQ